MTARTLAGALLLAAAGCGATPPSVFVGESAHFRLYVDPALMPLPAAFSGDNGLAALETQRSDFATMLRMPGYKIAYYWYATENVAAACGDVHVGGCTKEGELEIDAPTLPDDHELIHAYMYMRAQRHPIPFLAEGIAEAIACVNSEPLIAATRDADWRSAVAAVQTDDVYGQGGLFVRELIRTQGIDAVLRYYEQSPERRDPALFAANFESFWGMPLDDFWTEIHTVRSGRTWPDAKICPCSLPAIAPGGPLLEDPARAPYWTFPADLGDATLALTGSDSKVAAAIDCMGAARTITGRGILSRVGATSGWYIRAPLASAAVDRFASETCADIVPYPLPANLFFPYLTVMLPAASSATITIGVEVPTASRVDGISGAICDSCAFDQQSCPPRNPADVTTVSGSFYARLPVPSTVDYRGNGVATQELRIYP